MGFFYGEASRLREWSVSTLNSISYLSEGDLVTEIGGSYQYYCYVLADFDPIKARDIYENSSLEDVTKAIIAKNIYTRPRDGK